MLVGIVKSAIRITRAKLGLPNVGERNREKSQKFDICSEWGADLRFDLCDSGVKNVLPEHPHPQFERDDFLSLNGSWDFCVQNLETNEAARSSWMHATPPESYDEKILVPFSPESALSGIERAVLPSDLLWYKTEVQVKGLNERQRLLLHFEAVDWACSVFVNGARVGTHTGGYTPFCFDVSNYCDVDSALKIEVCVYDPSDRGSQLRGKQRLKPYGMFYTAQSGIWQSVWIECVPEARVTGLRIDCSDDLSRTDVVVQCSDAHPEKALVVDVLDGDQMLLRSSTVLSELDSGCSYPWFDSATVEGQCALRVAFDTSGLTCWEPEAPKLYRLKISYGEDVVHSYFALRKVSLKKDEAGFSRLFLNGKPLFVKGVLSQGYWPESLMTAPSDDAQIFDIMAARVLGFNTIRVHAKVESSRWYFDCDRLGMLVLQDVPSGGDGWNDWEVCLKPSHWPQLRAQNDCNKAACKKFNSDDAKYREEWLSTAKDLIQYLDLHPSVVSWVLFNEGWGQFNAVEATNLARRLDSSRLIDSASGWFDQGCGDFISIHDYTKDPISRLPETGNENRALILSEFGGLSLPVPGHLYCARAFGYQDCGSPEEWAMQIKELLQKVEAYSDQGLAGYVYTQLTDIEEETNGLLTYDRLPKASVSYFEG